MDFQEYEIGGAVNGWIEESMDSGLTLMRMVKSKRKDDIGKTISSYWREGFRLDNVDDFNFCLCKKYPGIVDECWNWVAQKIVEYVKIGNRYAIFEDSIMGSTGSYLEDPDCSRFFTSSFPFYKGREVYYFMNAEDASSERVQIALGDAGMSGPYCNVILANLPEGVNLSRGQQVSDDLLALIAEKAEYLVFGAFDLEGYLWSELKG